MQDEQHIDKLINKAANKHTAMYDETAWSKMQILLDSQLPQKQNGRKRIAALLLLCVAITTIGVLLYTPKQSKIVTIAANKNPKTNIISQAHKTEKNIGNSIITNSAKTTFIAATQNEIENPNNNYDIYKPINYYKPGKALIHITSAKAYEDELEELTETASTTNSITTTIEEKKEALAAEQTSTQNQETTTSTTPKKKQSNLLQKLALNFSLGPDISFVNISKPLSAGVFVGGGISYSVTKNLNIQTGIYLSNKIYSADSANYHPPTSFWSNYNNLQNVHGTSLVYEFPIAATYNFNSKSKNNLFVSAGVSSYIVKKETYIYSYKNNLGQPDKRNYSIKEKDKYNFSVLTLSAGVQTKPDKKVAYKAEPFIKLPLSGIGFGKINLKSTGVMFSIGVKPFAKKS